MESLPGVYKSFKKNGQIYYRSSITYGGRHISLGSYECPFKAHNGYLLAKKIISTPSLSLYDYEEDMCLDFHKWVVLMNYRDHHYYFSTPIYMHKNYFSYFISYSEELLFDIQDLFYYANHKIHKRQGYYFVNDYGMQVNIMSRYGVKNHSVLGRDHRFVDGDCHNLRYDNIQIINPYYGVVLERPLVAPTYKSTLNIHGNYVIGRYKDMATAAIAYNKAIEYLHKNGIVHKDFPKNYISDIDQETYEAIYKKVKISKKILNLKKSSTK
ncbi:hypothetical protein [Petrocella sp. FN5]|uniref:hypothetical protein n=1 Tax=Petrocella sp. FN5 TaxID=3032002 RepID=UPI0023DBE463|nr:hypothetical protein [Petrocella sp. FN5]MDF1616530.1 hypothetical protein [Petrocella sp. FN5]